MADLTLYLGSKNYSSWSLRAWLAARQTGAAFDEVVFDLGAPGIRDRIREHSPSGRVPALRHGELVVWDSLAIFEYLAERFSSAGLWPAERDARAVARAVTAEMHAGFFDLRREMPFNVRRSSPGHGRTEGSERDIARILGLWRDCRTRFGAGGEFLFGAWSLADAAYAPVVGRFVSYAVAVDDVGRAYMDAVWNRPELLDWRRAAAAETGRVPEYDR